MISSESNSKQVAKNTLYLYFRMLLLMLISLYTSRVVLNTLGVSDYGTYYVVGGVVTLFSFLNKAMSTTVQRFLSFEIGKNNIDRLQKVFSCSVIIHYLIAVLIFILAETIGLWFLNSKMVFPAGKLDAANWVYQFAVFATLIGVIQVPYNAAIIAHEKMSFYAYVSIFEAILKLVVVFVIQVVSFEPLKSYAVLTFFVAVFIYSWYRIYCYRNFKKLHFITPKDKTLYKELVSFSSWSLFGSIANIGFRQGINIIVNIFFGVVVNAAMGIANQISNAANQFVTGFQTAIYPILTKTHAEGSKSSQWNLIFQSSKFSYFLLFFISLPILINTEYILKIWLKMVPDYSVSFCRLILIGAVIDSISGPLWVTIFATGKIKLYQIVVSSILLANILFSYIFVKIGFSPESILYIRMVLYLFALLVRMYFIKYLIGLPLNVFINNVLLKILYVTILSLPIPIIILLFVTGLKGFLISSFLSIICVGITVFYIGMIDNERLFLLNSIRKYLPKLV
jgi:O-antigen/teichoic acid export membrane protein